MEGPVGTESPSCLLELALAARSVAPAGVVPGDGDMDEPLEEVALGRFGLAPFVLELLVRLEVGSHADQFEPVLERHAAIIRVRAGCYCRRVATILLVGVDLFFRGKLEGLLPEHQLVTKDSALPPDLVVCDIARIDPLDVADNWPDVPILGYANHTDTAGLRAGHAAGFDQVVVKSALVERAPELVTELTGD